MPDGTESFEVAIASAGLEGFFANADPGMGNTAFGVQTGFATFDVVYDTGADTVTLENVTNTVPAPGSMAVSGIGGSALLGRRFRTRRG
jgi:hypothetical protein